MTEHTFVVCAYKESQYLEECINSLRNQSIKSNILIATSTPNDYIKGIADKYAIPYYINEGEGGITQDWNFAYSCADSKYITIAHQDDIYDRTYLETALKYMKNAKHPLIFFSDYYEIRDGEKVANNKLLKVKRIMLLPLRIKIFRSSVWVRRRILSLGSPICCPSVSFAVRNLPKVVFENHYRACEDWEAWEKISRKKGQFLYSKEKLMGHRIHEESETTAAIGDNKRSREEFEMFCKFWPSGIAKIIEKFYGTGQNSNQL
ncbi:glycosyltransferase [Blautia sp. HCP28S3_G10]|uniref:glycosyltransferase n=1 Tax=Blautia sp. HCP28S3_G10 TaxID=3438908 RepID=UPI003F8A3FA1